MPFTKTMEDIQAKIKKVLEEEPQVRGKEDAIESLQNVGILDERGEIKEAYKDIVIKKEQGDETWNKR